MKCIVGMCVSMGLFFCPVQSKTQESLYQGTVTIEHYDSEGEYPHSRIYITQEIKHFLEEGDSLYLLYLFPDRPWETDQEGNCVLVANNIVSQWHIFFVDQQGQSGYSLESFGNIEDLFFPLVDYSIKAHECPLSVYVCPAETNDLDSQKISDSFTVVCAQNNASLSDLTAQLQSENRSLCE